jgi:hypothetical protein
MELHRGKIIRVVSSTVYPIDIYSVTKILKRLAQEVLAGRLNTQLRAAETLGLAWICLTASRRRLPTRFSLISGISTKCLSKITSEFPVLSIPTLYWDTKMPIPKTMAQYLEGLKNIGSQRRNPLFQSNSISHRRVLDRIVGQLCDTEGIGKITFLSFLSFPHESYGQR